MPRPSTLPTHSHTHASLPRPSYLFPSHPTRTHAAQFLAPKLTPKPLPTAHIHSQIHTSTICISLHIVMSSGRLQKFAKGFILPSNPPSKGLRRGLTTTLGGSPATPHRLALYDTPLLHYLIVPTLPPLDPTLSPHYLIVFPRTIPTLLTHPLSTISIHLLLPSS